LKETSAKRGRENEKTFPRSNEKIDGWMDWLVDCPNESNGRKREGKGWNEEFDKR